MSTLGTVNEFVFRELANGQLALVGDFEGLYKSDPDPWQQSGDGNLDSYKYYGSSRANLISAVRRWRSGPRIKGLEIGCGHGHVVNCLASTLGSEWSGMDVSVAAINKARVMYPEHSFFAGDITKLAYLPYQYDVVVLGQLLWYIMYAMDTVIDNCYELLPQDGMLIISQAYLVGPQRYGRELVDGFDGTLRLLLNNYKHKFRLIEARYEDKLGLMHDDGLIVLRKV